MWLYVLCRVSLSPHTLMHLVRCRCGTVLTRKRAHNFCVFTVADGDIFVTKIVDTQVDGYVIKTFTVKLYAQRRIVIINGTWPQPVPLQIACCTVKLELYHHMSYFFEFVGRYFHGASVCWLYV